MSHAHLASDNATDVQSVFYSTRKRLPVDDVHRHQQLRRMRRCILTNRFPLTDSPTSQPSPDNAHEYMY